MRLIKIKSCDIKNGFHFIYLINYLIYFILAFFNLIQLNEKYLMEKAWKNPPAEHWT